jgi:hypothetical protein
MEGRGREGEREREVGYINVRGAIFSPPCRWLNKEFLVLENDQVITLTDMRRFALRINSKPFLLDLNNIFTVN